MKRIIFSCVLSIIMLFTIVSASEELILIQNEVQRFSTGCNGGQIELLSAQFKKAMIKLSETKEIQENAKKSICGFDIEVQNSQESILGLSAIFILQGEHYGLTNENRIIQVDVGGNEVTVELIDANDISATISITDTQEIDEEETKQICNFVVKTNSHSFIYPDGKTEPIESFSVSIGSAYKFLRGDFDRDGEYKLNDAVSILDYLFRGGESPVCMDSIDVDDNGLIDISDAIGLLSYINNPANILNMPPPNSVPWGYDPTFDDFECCGF